MAEFIGAAQKLSSSKCDDCSLERIRAQIMRDPAWSWELGGNLPEGVVLKLTPTEQGQAPGLPNLAVFYLILTLCSGSTT